MKKKLFESNNLKKKCFKKNIKKNNVKKICKKNNC